MRITLVGADGEENLGLGMVAAGLLGQHHEVTVVPFDEAREVEKVVAGVQRSRPDVVGLAMQFQFRSPEFMELAHRLRAVGFSGHLTAGGQHATLAHRELLSNDSPLDSIVLFEGEATMAELVASLAEGAPLSGVSGLALPAAGDVQCTPPRPLHPELDALPVAHRYRPHSLHLGFPFIPMSGSRGCWGGCAFCSITTYYRAARAAGGGGKRLRLRSVQSVATEMAELHHRHRGDTSIFCFHDDSLLLPRAEDTVARFESLERELRVRGVRRYGLIGKCRPDAVTPELAHELRALGVVRMFVGIENASQAGQDHLDRRTTTAMLERALSAFREAGIFTAYNLLLFEPDATLDDIRENARFLRRHAGIPGNFCRAEPFHGTPLHRRLAARGALLGDHLGWDYRIADDRVELAFRLTLAAFRERNYAADGVGNRHVGLGYMAQLLRVFLDAESPRAVSALARADQVLAEVARDSADGLEWASDTVERLDPRDAEGAERAAVELAQRITTQDRKFSRAIDRAMDELQVVAALARAPRRSGGRGPELAQRVALAGAMLATAACGGELSPQGDCGSPPSGGGTGSRGYFGGTGGVTLKVPPTDGGRGGAEGGQGGETAPRGGSGGGTGGYMEGDGGFPPTGGRVPTGGFVGDGGSPPSGGMLGDGGSPPSGGFVGDGGSPPSGGLAGDGGYPPTGGYTSGDGGFPPTAGVPSNLDGGAAGTAKAEPARRDEAVDHWRDTMPAIPSRSSDLPLHTPPPVILEGWAETGKIRVVAHGATAEMDLLWAGPGERDGRGSELVWTPGSPRDRLTLVVRHPGGVASTSLLAADANGAG